MDQVDTSNPPLRGNDQAQLLHTSTAYCRLVTRRYAKNFYYGLKLTPEPKRSAMYAIYAWMRAADDLSDEPGDAQEKTKRLDAFRRQTTVMIDPQAPIAAALNQGDGSGRDPMWPAVRKAVLDFHIPSQYFHEMIDGQMMDQRQTRYETFEQLYGYCHKVASVVGLACITVWGYSGGQATQTMAEHRGVALQLTNILRDLVDDALRGRVYLPAVELERYGYRSEDFVQQLLAGQVDGAFDQLMADQVARAHHYYEISAGLEHQIEPSCRPTSWAMMRIYRRLLAKIACQPRRVLTRAVRLSRLEKGYIALHAVWNRGLGR